MCFEIDLENQTPGVVNGGEAISTTLLQGSTFAGPSPAPNRGGETNSAMVRT